MPTTKNQKEEVNIEALYGKECVLSKDDFLKTYNINENGLSSRRSRKQY